MNGNTSVLTALQINTANPIIPHPTNGLIQPTDGLLTFTPENYKQLYDQALEDPDAFWSTVADQLHWHKRWEEVTAYNFDPRNGKVFSRWFDGGTTNLSYNALDRHVKAGRGAWPAIIAARNEPGHGEVVTYEELLHEVSKLSNVMANMGVTKRDNVTIYMPNGLESAIAKLACQRIGAPHSSVFSAFGPEALATRIKLAKSRFLITTSAFYRGKQVVPLKKQADEAMRQCDGQIEKCIVHENVKSSEYKLNLHRDLRWNEVMKGASTHFEPEPLDAQHTTFMLFTSGTTGVPKGMVHAVGGYMVWAYLTGQLVFGLRPGMTHFTASDFGWITGHTYGLYAPLLAGATTVLFEGTPLYPTPARLWQSVEKWGVDVFYGAPTTYRKLRTLGDQWPNSHDLSSLKVVGTVGEPCDEETFMWLFNIIGRGRIPVPDTLWMTETGGILFATLPGLPMRPAYTGLPLPGVVPAIVDESGRKLKPNDKSITGFLGIERPWPGLARTIIGDHARYEETYFSKFPGQFTMGDMARQEPDGLIRALGRGDDMIIKAGHNIGTGEVEDALAQHSDVIQAVVVGYPHEVDGQGIYAFVQPTEGVDFSKLAPKLYAHVRSKLGKHVTIDQFQVITGDDLPQTESGKNKRGLMQAIVRGDSELPDTSTLKNPGSIESLKKGRKQPPGLKVH